VNRNDLATWLIMALPLTIGYALSRLTSRRTPTARGLQLDRMDATTARLGVSAALMAGVLFLSTSRSGFMGLLVGSTALVVLSRSRVSARGRRWLIGGLTAIFVVGFAYANVGALAGRFGETFKLGVGGRRAIWHDTLSVIADFWPTGTGVGSFERSMLVYQQHPRLSSFNHAHNEYLQVAAEGGLLVSLPLIAVLVVATYAIRTRLERESSPAFWIRAGAASGLIAVAAQSVLETGLRMPANAALFALLAAIAVRDRMGRTRDGM
jgi:O-antigen ligase